MEKPSECSICMNSFCSADSGNGNGNSLSALKCGHVFHDKCIVTWKRISKTELKCPLCRLESKGTLKLFLRMSSPDSPSDASRPNIDLDDCYAEEKDLIISQLGEKISLLEDELELLRGEVFSSTTATATTTITHPQFQQTNSSLVAIDQLKQEHMNLLRRLKTQHERQLLKEREAKKALQETIDVLRKENDLYNQERKTLSTLKVSKYIQDILDHPSAHRTEIFEGMPADEVKEHAKQSYKLLLEKEKEIRVGEEEISSLKVQLLLVQQRKKRAAGAGAPVNGLYNLDSSAKRTRKVDLSLDTISSFFDDDDGGFGGEFNQPLDQTQSQTRDLQTTHPQTRQTTKTTAKHKLQIPPLKMQKLKQKPKPFFY